MERFYEEKLEDSDFQERWLARTTPDIREAVKRGLDSK
jgi:hypothetical protein